MKENIIQRKSFEFGIRVIEVSRQLKEEKKEFILSNQFLESGISIGAHVDEAIGNHSEKEFISKISISYKEARKTIYWIRLLGATHYLDAQTTQELFEKADELCHILSAMHAILISSKSENSSF